MIFTKLVEAWVSLITSFFGWIPEVTELPFGIDAYLVTAVGAFKYYFDVFPPFQTVTTAFLLYVGFKGTIIFMRLILGARSPVQQVSTH